MSDAETRRRVRLRAGDACEYCGLLQIDSPFARLDIEHVLPKKLGGDDSYDNLALACIDCNLAKGANIAGMDPQTDRLTPSSILAANRGKITLRSKESLS
jgi:5-methylcytosine-specific restriction endonuclease McrA